LAPAKAKYSFDVLRAKGNYKFFSLQSIHTGKLCFASDWQGCDGVAVRSGEI